MPGAQAEGPPVSCSWPHRTTDSSGDALPAPPANPVQMESRSMPGVAPHMWRGRQSWLQIVGSRPVSEWLARVAVLALAPNSWLATCLQIVGAGDGVGSKELAAQGNIHKYGARRPANMNNRPAGCGKTGKCEQAAHHITAMAIIDSPARESENF